jgi:hypothetical protein
MRCSAPVSRWFVAALLSSLVAALVLLDGTKAQTAKKPAAKGRDKEISNSIGMKLVRIPAGKFWMGSTKEEQDEAIADHEKTFGKKALDAIVAELRAEGPRHQVEITKAFYLGAAHNDQAFGFLRLTVDGNKQRLTGEYFTVAAADASAEAEAGVADSFSLDLRTHCLRG